MTEDQKLELLEQIDQWNEKYAFSRCIEAIEAVPKEERDYLLTLKLGRAYSNLAVLGDRGFYEDEKEVDRELLGKALELLESIRTQGESDPAWNARMGYVHLMSEDSAAAAYEYARRWLLLAPEDEAARKLLQDCRRFLEDEKKKETEGLV